MTNIAALALPGQDVPLCHQVVARMKRLGQRVRLNGLGHRRLSESDTRSLITALLRDIDETILPRHVQVATNTGQRFALDIAGRRLLRLVVPGRAGTISQPDDPVEAAQALAQELHRALLRATEVTLQSHRLDSTQDCTDVGSSAAALASVLGLDLDALVGESITDKLVRSLDRHAEATLILDDHGGVTHRLGGDTAGLEDLARAQMSNLIAAMDRAMGHNATSGCLTLGTDAATGAFLVCTFCESTYFLALVNRQKMDMLLPVLQDIFAR